MEGAYRGYKDINIQAIRLVRDGGILATSSCSQKLSEETFLKILNEAASDNRAELKVLYRGGQAPDHPVPLGMPEARYLKFFVLKVKKF